MTGECPHCSSTNIVKNGMLKERQRYLCKDCKRSYNERTGTALSGLRKSLDTWNLFLELSHKGYSLRKIASILNITLKSIFLWRHKFLNDIHIKQGILRDNNILIRELKYTEDRVLVFIKDYDGNLIIQNKDEKLEERLLNQLPKKPIIMPIGSRIYRSVAKKLGGISKYSNSQDSRSIELMELIISMKRFLKSFNGVKYLDNYIKLFMHKNSSNYICSI